ncbi:MAG: hypothetical protein ACRDQ9_19065, partial [Pseudonocardiaceae bacterium]
ALHLLDRPRDLYDTATEHARKLLNKAIFTRLYVDTNPTHHPTITTDDLQEPFGSLIHAIRTTHTGQQPPDPQNSTDTRQHNTRHTSAAYSPPHLRVRVRVRPPWWS